MQCVTGKDERPTGLPGGDSFSDQERAEQLLGGQSSATQGGGRRSPSTLGCSAKRLRMNTMLLLG